MLTLHGLKGQITSQVMKNLQGEEVRLLASNLSRAEGSSWQCVLKCRKTNTSFPAEYNFILGIYDAFQKTPYFVELTEAQVWGKLRAWNYPAVEIEKLIKIIPEVK